MKKHKLDLVIHLNKAYLKSSLVLRKIPSWRADRNCGI